MTSATRWSLTVAGTLLLLAALSGCKKDFTSEADILRAQVLDLETEVQRLARREAELLTQLGQARTEAQRRLEDEQVEEPLMEGIEEHIPHVVDINIGRLSHARDRSGDGLPDTLVIYVNTVDGRGRFVQAVGAMLINAIILPPDADPIPLGRVRYGPREVRDAYRSGITGTHYTLHVPIRLSEEVDTSWVVAQQATVRVTFVDGRTGRQHTAERTINLRL